MSREFNEISQDAAHPFPLVQNREAALFCISPSPGPFPQPYSLPLILTLHTVGKNWNQQLLVEDKFTAELQIYLHLLLTPNYPMGCLLY